MDTKLRINAFIISLRSLRFAVKKHDEKTQIMTFHSIKSNIV